MSFEQWHDNEILIRFEHILEKDEDPLYSKPVVFHLKDVLRNFVIQDIRETTLDGNEWFGDNRRLEFLSDPEVDTYEKYESQYRTSSVHSIHLLSAKKPFLETKYVEGNKESSSGDSLNVESRTSNENSKGRELNRMRSEKLAKLKYKIDVDNIGSSNDDDDKFTIEMQPMQIRTFVLTLEIKY